MIFRSEQQIVQITLYPDHRNIRIARQQEKKAREIAKIWAKTKPESAERLLEFADLAKENIQKLAY